MECSCAVSCPVDEEKVLDMTEQYLVADQPLQCCECNKTIEKGEKYLHEEGTYAEFEEVYRQEELEDDEAEFGCLGQIPEEYMHRYDTCLDCKSIRDEFFSEGWIYGSILDDLYTHFDATLSPTEGGIDEKCLAVLTPGAREKVCELIETVWEEMEEELES